MNRIAMKYTLLYVFIGCVILTGCPQSGDTQRSDEKSIINFSIGDTVGVIEADEISVIMPVGTNLDSLEPMIIISGGASIFPASGAVNDFTYPATYTVTAENGSTRVYTVTVIWEPELTLELVIGLVKNGDDTISIYGLPENDIKLSVGKINNLSNSIVISTGGAHSSAVYDYVIWYIDGVQCFEGDNIITIYADDYTFAIPHIITIIVVKDGVAYSTAITFTVEP